MFPILDNTLCKTIKYPEDGCFEELAQILATLNIQQSNSITQVKQLPEEKPLFFYYDGY